VGNFEVIAAALSQEGLQIASLLKDAETPVERWKLVPQATINAFFYHLATQLYGPERWRAKFVDGYTAKGAAVKKLGDLERNTDYDEHAVLERELGNWTSATLRRRFVVVHSPHVAAVLQEIVERLKIVAKEADRQVEVYIIASPEINAFAVPNGDIFVTTGLLEALDSVDEVAAVIGHELDHLFQHDTTARLESMRTARIIQNTLMVVGAVGGAVGGAVVGLAASGGAIAAASSTPSITTNVLTNLASNSIQMASGVVGQSIGTAMVSGHSQETELRADYNSARYLWAAGYNVEASVRMLEKLQHVEAKAKERSEPIASGFLNAQPGLEKRLASMRTTLGQLRSLAEVK
jgi:predicted Zn-dependent protease